MERVLDERGNRYGRFSTQAEISQGLQHVMARGYAQAHEGGSIEDIPAYQREALSMIANKLGRILNGDSNYADSWVDIAGYATLVADILEGKDEH